MAIGQGTTSGNQARHDHVARGRQVGFFTDPTVCIGCKACEVACKEWNLLPEDGAGWTGNSYDNTGALGASTWRHVKFVERGGEGGGGHPPEAGRAALAVEGAAAGSPAGGVAGERGGGAGRAPAGGTEHRRRTPPAAAGGGPPAGGAGAEADGSPVGTGAPADPFRWIFLSDVCKHCGTAGCLEACPTGAIVRTETGGVFVQDDVCNGCGYCVVGCPFGVVDRRPEPRPGAGGAFKCTFCYDRQAQGLTPACAKACPTEAIQFGPLDELKERAAVRVEEVKARGWEDARLYDPVDTSVGGLHAFFLVPGDPREFGLPPKPEAPVAHLRAAWTSAALASAALVAAALAAFGAA